VELPAGAKFCFECGTPLDSLAAAPRETRKVVTVLFSDVTGSTALGEALDPEAVRALMSRYFAAMKTVIERHGGTVEKFIGDAIMAVFGIPVLHEDDALRAVRAAADMRETLAALNAELAAERGVTIATRTGVTTGEVVAGDPAVASPTLVTGDTVNTAARLEQAAAPGEILLGAPTWRLVRDAVSAEPVPDVDAKGKALPVQAYRLVSVATSAEGHYRRLDAPLVGRERELSRLQQAYRDAVEQHAPQLFTLLGAAGVGKSRLVSEFLTGLADTAKVLRGRCLPYGDGITYWPLAEALRAGAGIADADDRAAAARKLHALVAGERDAELLAARLATAIGLSEEAAAQAELFSAVRRTLEFLARQWPLVVVFEDIHWAEPTFLDLLDHLAEWSRDAPLLLLTPSRPELLDLRPGWGGGKLNTTTLLLEALPPEAAGRLIDALPGGTVLPAPLRERISAAAEGNPLFLEELLAMLVDDGVLGSDGGRWVAVGELAQLAIPPTIQALLAARLDRLAPDERRVAERASVVGRVFEPEAVAALSPEESPPAIDQRLMALVRKELVRPDFSEVTGGDAFKFRHMLIRDAAYNALPKRERAELHERLADWLEHITSERVGEFAEIIGHHLGEAVRYRDEMGLKHEVQALRAASWLLAAGRRAYDRSDLLGAAALLRRGLQLSPPGTQVRQRALPDAIRTMVSVGDLVAARALADEAVDIGEPTVAADAALMQGFMEMITDPAFDPESMLRRADHAIEVFTDTADDVGLARGWRARYEVLTARGQYGEALSAAERAHAHAKRAENRRLITLCQGDVAAALIYGPTEASTAERRIRALSSDGQSAGESGAARSCDLAWLQAIQGHFDLARATARDALKADEEAGARPDVLYDRYLAARVEMLADEWTRARDLLLGLDALASVEAPGDHLLGSSIRSALAECQLNLGDVDGAAGNAARALEQASAIDIDVQLRSRSLLARTAAAKGDAYEAVRLSTEAAELSTSTDMPELRADALLAKSVSLRALGDTDGSRTAAEEAGALYRAKGHAVGAARAGELLAS
jgi:class 3 adenylate cyclase